MSIGIGRETYENENDWLNDIDKSFGSIALALDDDLYFVFYSAEHPKDLWTRLDKTFGKHNEDHNLVLWRLQPAPQEFFTQNSQALLSLMKLFKMKMKQNLLHIQFELKKVSMK